MSTTVSVLSTAGLSRFLLRSQLRRNMLVSVGLAAVSAAVMAASYTYYLHRLGYELYGLWLVLSTVVAFSQVGNLGISQVVAKKIAEHWPDGDIREIAGYTTAASLLVCVSGGCIVTAIAIFRTDIAAILNLSASTARMFVALVPGVAIFSVYLFIVDIFNSTLNGLGRLDLSALCQSSAQLGAFIITAGLLLLSRNVEMLLIGNIAGYIIAHVLSIYLCSNILGTVPFGPTAVRTRHLVDLLKFGGWMSGSALLNLLITPMNRAILTKFGGVSLVPLYDIPLNSCMRVRSLLDMSQRALISEVSGLAKTDRGTCHPRLRQLSRRAFRLMLMFAPIFGCLALFAGPLLSVWLGTKYTPAMKPCFQIISVGVFVGTLGVPAYYILLGAGRATAIFTSNLVQASTNVVVLLAIIFSVQSLTAVNLVTAASFGMAAGGIALIWNERKLHKNTGC